MPRNKSNSRALRLLAEDFLRRVAEDEEIPADEREDFVTSLVRQWITYDGNATCLLGEQQVYLVLAKTPLGQFCIVPEPGLPGWMKQLREDWKISPEDLPDIIGQLNLGQSAEATNTEGVPLRLWVNPRERSRGVEPLVKQPVPPGRKRDYRKVAANELEQQFGTALEADEMEALACSVAKQWQQFEGHACLFLDGDEQLSFTLTERDDGGCGVVARRLRVGLGPLLSSLGFPPEVAPEVVARINLGQEVEFRDRKGVPSVLSHDPKARRVVVRVLAPAPPGPQSGTPPVFCPKCGAVLRLWNGTEQRQTCPLCGNTVSLC
jgi:hypothetical protein